MLLPQMILRNCDLEASNAIYSLTLFYMSFACHWHVIHMHSHVTRISFVSSHMSSLCTRMPSVYHSYVLVCHPYVTRMSPVCH